MGIKSYDVIIIGGGVAGISSALWCNELGLDAIILESESELGGQLLWTYNNIQNYLGTEVNNGRDLRDIFLKQLEKRTPNILFDCKVCSVDLLNKKVETEKHGYLESGAIIIATGVRRRSLEIEGEKRFAGKGILQSGKKESDKTPGKKVLVVGGGDAALENALIIAEKAEKVFVAHRRNDFRARSEFIDKALENKRIELLRNKILTELNGNEHLENAILRDPKTNKTVSLEIDFTLFRLGVVPNSELFNDELTLDRKGYIEIDYKCETNIEEIYSVGDVSNPISPTISTAVGMGATAVKSILTQ